MPNPIQPQPIEPVRGPFSQFLEAPKMAQLQQFEQVGPQPSGREGPTGQVAMYLTRFMQGASVAKAREQAQTALQEARDADSINRLYSAMGQSDKDPEDLQRLHAQINDMAGRHVLETMKEGGKKNPILKGLHMIGEQILGGPQDKDQYVPVDQNAVHAMWSTFAQLPSMGDKYNAASQQLTSHLADIKAQLTKEMGRIPSQSEFQEKLAQVPIDVNGKTMSILDAGNAINEKFRKPSPVDQFMSVLGPQPNPFDDMKRKMASTLIGHISGTSEGPPTAGGPPDKINPAQISLMAGDKDFGHMFQQDKEFYFNPNRKNDRDGVWKDVWNVAGTKYDASTGEKLDQERIEPKVLSAARASGNRFTTFNVQEPGGKVYLAKRDNTTGKVFTLDDKEITDPNISQQFASQVNAASNNEYRAVKLKSDAVKAYGENYRRYGSQLQAELATLGQDRTRTKMNPQTGQMEAAMTPGAATEREKNIRITYDNNIKELDRLYRAQVSTLDAYANGLSVKKEDIDSIQNHIDKTQGKADLDGMNNPLGLKNQNGFVGYESPEKGLEAGKNLLRAYMSPQGAKAVSQTLINRGVKVVNADSTLGDLMEQWAPYGDGANDPKAYAESIAKALNLPGGINTKIGSLAGRVDEIARVMAQTEGGSQWKSLFGQQAAAAAQGGTTPPPPAATPSQPTVAPPGTKAVGGLDFMNPKK